MGNRISAINYKITNNTRNNITFKSNSNMNFVNEKAELKDKIAKTTIGAMGLSFLAGGIGFRNTQKFSVRLGLASALILLGLFISFPIYNHLDKLDIKNQNKE